MRWQAPLIRMLHSSFRVGAQQTSRLSRVPGLSRFEADRPEMFGSTEKLRFVGLRLKCNDISC